MADQFDDIVREYIDFVNRQVGVYMDAIAGFEKIKVAIERQVHRVQRPTGQRINEKGEPVVVWSSYEDPTQPDIIHNRISRAVDYIDANSRGGANEQQHSQSMIVFLVAQWEHSIRPRLASAKGVELNEIKSDVLGDLTIARNAILHNKARIKQSEHKRLKRFGKIFESNEEIFISYDNMHKVFYSIKRDLAQLLFDWLGVANGPDQPHEIRDIAIQRVHPGSGYGESASNGFQRRAMDAIGQEWTEIEEANAALRRLRDLRVSSVEYIGDAARSKIVWKIRGFQQVALYRLVMLADGCAAGWNAENTLSSVLCARALLETIALVLDFESRLTVLCGEGNLNGIDDLVMNRSFATRLPDWQDEGAGMNAINVLTLIEKLDKNLPGVSRHYARLSEMCHPNSLGTNGMFGILDKAERAIRLSEKTTLDRPHFDHVFGCYLLLGLAESAMKGIEVLLPKVLELSEAAAAG